MISAKNCNSQENRSGRTEAAIDSTKQQIDLGKAEVQRGEFEAANARFESILAAAPDNAEAIHAMAVISAHRKNTETAMALAGKAHRLAPSNMEFANTLNLIRFMNGDKLGAVKGLAQVVNEHPGDRETHINVAEMAGATGLSETAYLSLELYLSHAGRDEQVLNMIGQLFDNVLASQPPPQLPG